MLPPALARVGLTATCAALLLPACGSVEGTGPPPSRAPAGETRLPALPVRPADLRLRGGEGWVDVAPHTWCAANGCADGVLPDPLPDLGTTDDPVLIDLPGGWAVQHTWSPVGADCGPGLAGPVLTSAGEPLEIPPSGAAGTWQLDLIVWPVEGGDVVAAAQVTTTRDAALPAPELRLTSFFDHDGEIVQYGPVELDGRYLPPAAVRTSGEDAAEATLTVESADGRTSTVPLEQAGDAVETCVEPGRLLLREPGPGSGSSEHLVGGDLGEPPYALTLVLDLAGTIHTGTATWPADVSQQDSTIRMQVTPPLPRPEPADLVPDPAPTEG